MADLPEDRRRVSYTNREHAASLRQWQEKSEAADSEENWIIFYDQITKVRVVPERESFTIQVVTPDVEFEMEFANAQEVREAFARFEEKRVFLVDFEVPNSVRIAWNSQDSEE